MTSGKSSAGRLLAERMNTEFIDLDEFIEKRAGFRIPELFKHFGENTFRQMETSALRNLPDRPGLVIATGGGAPCFNENLSYMKENGTVIYLSVDEEVLFERLIHEKEQRPLVAQKSDKELKNFISHHLGQRSQYYEQAHIVVDAKDPVSEVVKNILEQLS